jgi:hypothetical protein
MTTSTKTSRIYDGDGDQLMVDHAIQERLIVLPDGRPSKQADNTARVRIMWGQHLLDDVVAGRYRSIVCAVNDTDNSKGIISKLAELVTTSQWTPESITAHTQMFAHRESVTVIKFDMDTIEVLGLLRPTNRDHLTLDDLGHGFSVASEMVRRKPSQRLPVAAVSFLGAHANALVDEHGQEPSFETVLRTMHDSGFSGDVYPAPWMWESAPTGVYARYPFPPSLENMRMGGF